MSATDQFTSVAIIAFESLLPKQERPFMLVHKYTKSAGTLVNEYRSKVALLQSGQ